MSQSGIFQVDNDQMSYLHDNTNSVIGGYVRNRSYWYPVSGQGRSNVRRPRRAERGRSPSWLALVCCLAVSVLLVVAAIAAALALVYAEARRDPCPRPGRPTAETSARPSAQRPALVPDNGTLAIDFPESLDWRVLGLIDRGPLKGYVDVDHGYVVMTSGSFSAVELSVSKSSTGYDDPDQSGGRQFTSGRLNASTLRCFFSEFEIDEAFVFSWINFTLSNQSVGDFQLILAFANSRLYVMRKYSDDIIDIETNQFAVVSEDVTYEGGLMAADVKGKHEIIALSEPPIGTNLFRVTKTLKCGG